MILKYNQKHIATLVLAGALIVSGFLVTSAQTADTTGDAEEAVNTAASIVFPVAELGNCANKDACKAYCDITANAQACLDFAESHRLMSVDKIAKARKMASIAQTGGPGGCKTKEECATYCEASTDRLTECLAFAERTGLVPQEELREMRQIHSALASGAKLPGGCKNKGECENYCSDSSHIEECISFAETSGMLKGKELDEAKKVLPFIRRGETPGGCKTKEACQAYCADSSHATECVSFAEKAGFISREEAEMVRKTGGKGPGGCNSKESCEAFCNQKENQQTCFAFAKENNLIPAEELKKIEEGTARLRVGLSQMPGEVVQCLKDKIGADAVGQIESGKLAPSRDIGDVIQGCFNQFKPQMAAKIQEGLKNAPPEVLTCLQSSLGDEDFRKMQQGDIDSPEKGDKVKTCFEGVEQAARGRIQEGAKQLDRIPEQARDCVKQKLGGDLFERMQSGEQEKMRGLDQAQIQSVIGQCMSQNAVPGGAIPGDAVPGTGQIGPAQEQEQIQQMIQRGRAPTQEEIQNMMQRQGAPSNVQGAPSSEQIRGIMERQGARVPERNGNENRNENRPDIPAGPTPEQIRQMMQNRGPVPAPGSPANIPPSGSMGPTPQQIQQMMQGQIPQAIPQTVAPQQSITQPAPIQSTAPAPTETAPQ